MSKKEENVDVSVLARAVEQSGSSIVITDVTGNIEFVNRLFSIITGYSLGEVLGKNPRIFQSGQTPQKAYQDLWGRISEGNIWRGELYNKKKNGEFYWESAIIASVKNSDGEITHYVAVKEDITARKKMERTLVYLANHDGLTGLANRTLFREHLTQLLKDAKRADCQVAILFVDLDAFKSVNDRFGHDAGDKFLQAIGQRLKAPLRERDIVARLGGDEFAVALGMVYDRDGVVVVVKKLLDFLRLPFRYNGNCIDWISATIGISLCPWDGYDADELLIKADAAMYHAKRQGKDNYAFYNGSEKQGDI